MTIFFSHCQYIRKKIALREELNRDDVRNALVIDHWPRIDHNRVRHPEERIIDPPKSRDNADVTSLPFRDTCIHIDNSVPARLIVIYFAW